MFLDRLKERRLKAPAAVTVFGLFERLTQAFDTVVSNPQVAKCLACTAIPSGSVLTVEEAVAAYMDLQLRRAAAATLPTKDGGTPDTSIWEVCQHSLAP